eukprot:Nitzschia sp. Nitz4//scaffold26_size159584//70620//71092//NITZ4_002490-RA/size159584-snap-gene-0.30-mRNA-1//-1//CDS//3329545079//8214//frame0
MGQNELSEKYCTSLLEKSTADIPEACKKYASVKERLEADKFAGMTPGAKAQVKSAQIKRRMSTRHGQGTEGKKSSWF